MESSMLWSLCNISGLYWRETEEPNVERKKERKNEKKKKKKNEKKKKKKKKNYDTIFTISIRADSPEKTV